MKKLALSTLITLTTLTSAILPSAPSTSTITSVPVIPPKTSAQTASSIHTPTSPHAAASVRINRRTRPTERPVYRRGYVPYGPYVFPYRHHRNYYGYPRYYWPRYRPTGRTIQYCHPYGCDYYEFVADGYIENVKLEKKSVLIELNNKMQFRIRIPNQDIKGFQVTVYLKKILSGWSMDVGSEEFRIGATDRKFEDAGYHLIIGEEEFTAERVK